jgi:hypothetical protein
MTIKRLAVACVAAAAIATAGCATMRVGTYVERTTDFSRYHTYAWAPADALPTGDPRLDNNAIFRDYLQGAVERHLRGHRLLLVPASARPDLLIHFHGSVRQMVDVSGADRARGVLAEEIRVVDYDQATVVLDMVDARTDRLVWRGWAIDSLAGILDSQDRMERTIEEAVTRMLAGLTVL